MEHYIKNVSDITYLSELTPHLFDINNVLRLYLKKYKG